MKEKVCVVLVNFKGHLDTIECLESLLKSTYQEFQILVVDNSPDDFSITAILDWANGKPVTIATSFPELINPPFPKPISYAILTEQESIIAQPVKKLILIKAKINKGFAAGNNIAIRIALKQTDVKFIWLLNNDTVVEPTTLEQLVKFAEQSKAGMIGAKLLYYHNPLIIQALGGRYNPWVGQVTEICLGEPDSGNVNNLDLKMEYVVGASMFMKRECIEDIGLMNESLFLYFEELDWAIRAKKKGWTLDYCPARIYHKVGASTKAKRNDNSKLADFYFARNRILIAKWYFPSTLITLYPAFILFVLKRIWRGQFDRILMLFKIIIKPSAHLKKYD